MTAQNTPESARPRVPRSEPELTVRIQYVIVDGPEGAALERRQRSAIRNAPKELARQQKPHDHENAYGE
jgi:hypothetical protein